MTDGLSGWERMLAEQAAELEKLRGFLADYEAKLKATRSAVALLLATADLNAAVDDEQSERLRWALRVVQARIDRTDAARWRCYGNATGVEKYPGELLEYVTKVLEENPADGGTDTLA